MPKITIKWDRLDETPKMMAALKETMRYIGEEAVKEGRSKTKENDWRDRTGNLRSSIGYNLRDSGASIAQNLGSGTAEGQKAAASLLDKLRDSASHVLDLTVVAGMEYASYVQDKGRNVLASAQLKAEALAEKMFAKFK